MRKPAPQYSALAITLLFAIGAAACTAETESSVEATEDAVSGGRSVGRYDAELSMEDAQGRDFSLEYLKEAGFRCSLSTHAKYREMGKSPTGEPELRTTDAPLTSRSGSTTLGGTFTRDYLNTRPEATGGAYIQCSGYAGSARERYLFRNTWSCLQDKLPERVGEAKDVTCKGRFQLETGSMSNLAGRQLEVVEGLKETIVRFRVKLAAKSSLFDIDNCPADTTGMDRFYLRITQGLDGGMFEQDFRLDVKLDDVSLAPLESRSGAFSHAVSFCRPQREKKLLRVALSGVEEDLIFDDIYTSAPEDDNVLVKPGTRREFKLLRGSKESFVVVELFSDQAEPQP